MTIVSIMIAVDMESVAAIMIIVISGLMMKLTGKLRVHQVSMTFFTIKKSLQ